MINFRKIAATSALGLSMGLALLGTGVASAHNSPNSTVGIKNSSNVRVSVVQNVNNIDRGYGHDWDGDCGCYYGYGVHYYNVGYYGYGYNYGWGWPWGW